MKAGRYEELFREKAVLTMGDLKLATGRPRESVLRDLKGVGYYSSYNARGRFYTLASIPEFDDLGLWKCGGAYFSMRRTLLETAEYLISASEAGHTHDELRRMLGIAAHNSLHQLTAADRIVRRHVGVQYVYFGKENADDQLERRSAALADPAVQTEAKNPDAKGYPDIDPILVIDILVAALRGHVTDSAAHSHLRRTGSPATAQQVRKVFRYYGIGKKNSRTQQRG